MIPNSEKNMCTEANNLTFKLYNNRAPISVLGCVCLFFFLFFCFFILLLLVALLLLPMAEWNGIASHIQRQLWEGDNRATPCCLQAGNRKVAYGARNQIDWKCDLAREGTKEKVNDQFWILQGGELCSNLRVKIKVTWFAEYLCCSRPERQRNTNTSKSFLDKVCQRNQI